MMSKDIFNNVMNSATTKPGTPIATQYTSHTALHGEMSSTQIDREQSIKTFGICVGAGVAIASIFMICKAFGSND